MRRPLALTGITVETLHEMTKQKYNVKWWSVTEH